ncbi:unnamed protein product [Rhodiola kirilowii]
MATSPVNRHQQQNQNQRQHNPLHNFSFLKWGNKSHANSLHRARRITDPPTFEHERRQARRRLPTSYGVESREMHYDMKRFTVEEERGSGIGRRSLIGSQTARFDFASQSVEEREIVMEDGHEEEMEAEVDGREESQKLWNLRPRKTAAARNGHQIGSSGAGGSAGASSKNIDVHVNNGGSQDTVTAQPTDGNAPKSLRLRGMVDAHGGVEKKKEKAKLWISLSKEEIEEDIFILTGSRPARRPKRRPKTVQKQLDMVFPGLTLLGATADTFKIPDSPPPKVNPFLVP